MNKAILVFMTSVASGLVLPAASGAEPPSTGPVIEHYGPVFSVPEGSYNLVPGTQYKVSMDVGSASHQAGQPNRSIESMARFLNMHARNGINPGDLEIAIVIHGQSARAALHREAHARIIGQTNPSASLLEALAGKGVRFYLCGQTAAHYGYTSEDLLPEVTMAVSAMTVHVRLQSEGFTLIPF
ncbi:MAG: DsrE family protein [Xanthomonadales bacterium]|nr:DsrE family protein [Xanthomonadales bacterium]